MKDQNKGELVDHYYEEEIDLKAIFTSLYKAKWVVTSITLLFSIFSVIYALSLQDIYKSESILSIPDESSQSSSLSQYSGLASMAGLTLPNQNGSDKSLMAIQTINSRAFLKHLLTFEGILPSIMAAKSYDRSTGELLFNTDLYISEKNEWVRIPSKGRQIIPSHLESFKNYQKLVKVVKSDETGFISISVEHISPIFAKEFLQLIISEINNLMRKDDLKQSEMALSYLNAEVFKEPSIEIRKSIYNLIKSQLEKKMLTKIEEDYVLNVIEPAFIPEIKVKPNRSFICVLGSILGFLLSLILIFLKDFVFRKDVK